MGNNYCNNSCISIEKNIQINFKNERIRKYYKGFSSIIEIKNWISKTNSGSIDVYLISTKSIPNFINIVNNSKILERKIDIIEIEENYLNEGLGQYALDKNIKIYFDFQECKNLVDKDNEDNEFIIVDCKFLNSMDMRNFLDKKVELKINNKYSIKKIKFSNSKEYLYINEKKPGIFKFYTNNDLNQINLDVLSNTNNEINDKISISNILVQNNNNDDNHNRSISLGNSKEKSDLSEKIKNIIESSESLSKEKK